MAKLFLLLIISLIFAQSCVAPPHPVRNYVPQNEGKRWGWLDRGLEIKLPNGVKGWTSLSFNSFYKNPVTKKKEKLPDNLLFLLIFWVPQSQTVRLASDKVEFHSPKLSSPVVASVQYIQFQYLLPKRKGDISPHITLEYELDPYEELEGCGAFKLDDHSLCCICRYKVITGRIFLNENQVLKGAPKNVTVYLPEIYINDELHKIEPLRFKFSWQVAPGGN